MKRHNERRLEHPAATLVFEISHLFLILVSTFRHWQMIAESSIINKIFSKLILSRHCVTKVYLGINVAGEMTRGTLSDSALNFSLFCFWNKDVSDGFFITEALR